MTKAEDIERHLKELKELRLGYQQLREHHYKILADLEIDEQIEVISCIAGLELAVRRES